jgi:ParB family chromosome partitioning protein
MTIQPNPVPSAENGDVLSIPLNKLKASPRNARRTPHASADIETLAASIASKGMIQPPVVEPETDADGRPTGFYLVTVGEGRRQALTLRAKRKEVAKAVPVRCILDVTNDAFEVSLDENVTRFAMHPADQFEAFQKLAEERGFGPEEIGARFGVTPTVVRQRLRLAAASPNLIAAYRAGDMTLDQLMAFTVATDTERQDEVWASLTWNKEPALIRRLLVQDRVPARDRRATFVGPEAYLAAGGVIERDLFSEDHGGFYADPGLLERLALERLVAMTAEVREQGWKWVTASLDLPTGHGLRRVYPQHQPLTPEDDERRAAFQREYDELFATHEDDDEVDEAVSSRLGELGLQIEALDAQQRVFDPDDIARAGAFIVLGHDGQPRIERGYLRPEDETPVTANEDDGSDEEAHARDDEGAEDLSPLSDKLIADLTAHRTAALQDRLAEQPRIGLAAVAYALATQAFALDRSERSCIQLHLVAADLSVFAPTIGEGRAGQSIEARHGDWASELPRDPGALWPFVLTLPDDQLIALIVHCASLALKAVQTGSRRSLEIAHADTLAVAVGLDMADYWGATGETYLARVSKRHILQAVVEGAGEAEGRRIEGLKKAPMVEAAEALLKGTRWLPTILRADTPSETDEEA